MCLFKFTLECTHTEHTHNVIKLNKLIDLSQANHLYLPSSRVVVTVPMYREIIDVSLPWLGQATV